MVRADVESEIGMVVTDHMMPDVDGTQFVRELRCIVPNIPIVVISGMPEAESEYEGLGFWFQAETLSVTGTDIGCETPAPCEA